MTLPQSSTFRQRRFSPRWRHIVSSIAAGALALGATSLVAQAPGGDERSIRPDNYYAAGNRVEVPEPQAGDVIVAGRQVNIAQPVGGDVLAAGWRVWLSGRADDDVRIAGGEIAVNAPIAGDLTLAGGNVTLGKETRVSGRAWITGQTVRVDGVLERNVEIAGANVQIAGEIRQPLRVVAEKLEILPSARILAPMTYRGPSQAQIAEGATVIGPVTFDRITPREAHGARATSSASMFLFSVHLFLAGLLVLVFMPRVEESVVATLRAQPVKSLLAGFVLFVTVPIAAVLLVVSILGLPLGLALGALYAMTLFAGVLTTAFFVGEAEAKLAEFGTVATRRQHLMLLLAGVLTLAVLRSVFGGLVVFLSMLFGVGALMLWAYREVSHVFTPSPA